MLRFSKALSLSGQIGLTLLAVILAGGITNVQAAPVCNSTIVLPGGDGTVMDSALGPGVCVQSGDKLYGTFLFGTLPLGGAVTFTFNAPLNQDSIKFSNSFAPNFPYSFTYEAATVGITNFITQLSGDVTQTIGGPTALLQLTSVTPASGGIILTKTNNVISGSSVANYSQAQNVQDLIIASMFLTPSGSDASAVLNTFAEQVPEPASMETLLVALTGLAFGYLKLKPRWS